MHTKGYTRPSWVEYTQPDPDDRPPDPRQIPLPFPESEGRPAQTERPSKPMPSKPQTPQLED